MLNNKFERVNIYGIGKYIFPVPYYVWCGGGGVYVCVCVYYDDLEFN